MVIKAKSSKSVQSESNIESKIDKIINRGGKTIDDSDNPSQSQEEEVRFTLRISSGLIKKIDDSRKSRIGNVSRNQWILEVISKALD